MELKSYFYGNSALLKFLMIMKYNNIVSFFKFISIHSSVHCLCPLFKYINQGSILTVPFVWRSFIHLLNEMKISEKVFSIS
jgi:hypothetical protein